MIRLTKQTDYALVLLTHMARGKGETPHTARDLAVDTHIPLPMVSKILKALGREGLLASTRGVHGGYRLARPAEEITAAEVIGLMEGPIGLTECTMHTDTTCSIESFCPVSTTLQRINQAVIVALKDLSLAEMATPWRVGPPPPRRKQSQMIEVTDESTVGMER